MRPLVPAARREKKRKEEEGAAKTNKNASELLPAPSAAASSSISPFQRARRRRSGGPPRGEGGRRRGRPRRGPRRRGRRWWSAGRCAAGSPSLVWKELKTGKRQRRKKEEDGKKVSSGGGRGVRFFFTFFIFFDERPLSFSSLFRAMAASLSLRCCCPSLQTIRAETKPTSSTATRARATAWTTRAKGLSSTLSKFSTPSQRRQGRACPSALPPGWVRARPSFSCSLRDIQTKAFPLGSRVISKRKQGQFETHGAIVDCALVFFLAPKNPPSTSTPLPNFKF